MYTIKMYIGTIMAGSSKKIYWIPTIFITSIYFTMFRCKNCLVDGHTTKQGCI